MPPRHHRDHRTAWTRLIVALLCVGFLVQQSVVSLHFVMHEHALHVHNFDGHEQSGLIAVHAHGCESEQAPHQHVKEVPAPCEDDAPPHPVEDHLRQSVVVTARSTLDQLPLAAVASAATPGLYVPPSPTLTAAAPQAPRAPPPRASHHARAPPPAV